MSSILVTNYALDRSELLFTANLSVSIDPIPDPDSGNPITGNAWDAYLDGDSIPFASGRSASANFFGPISVVIPTGVHLIQIDASHPLLETGISWFGDVQNWVLSDGGLNIVGIDETPGSTHVDIVFGTDFDDTYSLGQNDDYVEAGAGDDYIDGGAGADIMLGGNGVDRYLIDSLGDVADETTATTNDEDIILSSISFSLADVKQFKGAIETGQLLGTADLNMAGNALANRLVGNSGANEVNGGAGADWLQGRGGNDIYTVDNAGDLVDESLGGSNGLDLVRSTVSFSLANPLQALGAVENVTLLGTANINALGNSLNNLLIGNTGANSLNGGAGADIMRGGAGDDTYIVDNAGDVVDESVAGSGGIDTVRSTISYSLAGALENLTLLGTANLNGLGNGLNNIIIGNAGANTLNGLLGADTMQGGAGNDIYAVDNAGDIVDESIAGSNGSDLVRSAISFSLADTLRARGAIENLTLIGTADINATGNSLANLLIGNTGANILNGGAGADTMQGGAGNDNYVVDNAGDVVDESIAGSNGNDLVRSAISFSLADAVHAKGAIEQLTLLGTADINALGNNFNNLLTGNTGANTLNGGAGADIMRGGAGDDTYAVDNAGDVVDESIAGSNGLDTVRATFSFSLADAAHAKGAIENLTLLGTANLNAAGNGLNNLLIGNTGANVMNGGLGADTMRGGAGNDSYVVDNAGDVVDESVAGSNGADLISSSISFSLADTVRAKGAIENLTLTGAGNINATGNSLANLLTGNAGANILNGGVGADVMRGGAGSDNYVVDNAGDVVDESIAGSNGTDLVRSAISFSLADTVHAKGAIEDLTLLGTANLNAVGNTLNNVLTGNSGANTLNGGAGVDQMRGGAGNDIYIVDNLGDVVDESTLAGSSGIDTVRSTVIFNLANTAQARGAIENVILLGSSDISASGSSLANALTGNTGNNLLAGGLGNDTLTGGAGNDLFLFHTALNATTNVDSITDMNKAGNDTIRLENAIFTTLGDGALAAGAFRIGAAAADADDRIIYNSANGQLSYDFNGNVAGGSTLFAILDPGLALTAADFFVV